MTEFTYECTVPHIPTLPGSQQRNRHYYRSAIRIWHKILREVIQIYFEERTLRSTNMSLNRKSFERMKLSRSGWVLAGLVLRDFFVARFRFNAT